MRTTHAEKRTRPWLYSKLSDLPKKHKNGWWNDVFFVIINTSDYALLFILKNYLRTRVLYKNYYMIDFKKTFINDGTYVAGYNKKCYISRPWKYRRRSHFTKAVIFQLLSDRHKKVLSKNDDNITEIVAVTGTGPHPFATDKCLFTGSNQQTSHLYRLYHSSS